MTVPDDRESQAPSEVVFAVHRRYKDGSGRTATVKTYTRLGKRSDGGPDPSSGRGSSLPEETSSVTVLVLHAVNGRERGEFVPVFGGQRWGVAATRLKSGTGGAGGFPSAQYEASNSAARKTTLRHEGRFDSLSDMGTLGPLIRSGVRNPRLRFLLVVLLLLVALALALHLVVVADHTMMMLEACFALLAVVVLLPLLPVEFIPTPARIERASPIGPPRLIITRGRYPPEEGTVLLD